MIVASTSMCFWATVDTPSPREKLFSKYARSMWYKSYSANVDTLGQLHDIFRRFTNRLKNYFHPKWKKVQRLFTFLRLLMPNRTSIQLFSLFNQRLRIPCNGVQMTKTASAYRSYLGSEVPCQIYLNSGK